MKKIMAARPPGNTVDKNKDISGEFTVCPAPVVIIMGLYYNYKRLYTLRTL